MTIHQLIRLELRLLENRIGRHEYKRLKRAALRDLREHPVFDLTQPAKIVYPVRK